MTFSTGTRTQGESWVDPIVGLDLVYHTGPWQLGARADIGGIDVGSELCWSILAGGQYRFSELFSTVLGYRWLDIDYDSGSGTDAFLFDVQLAGPFLAFDFTFWEAIVSFLSRHVVLILGGLPLLAFAVSTAIAVHVILDMELPRAGLVRVDASDRQLVELIERMK